MPSYIFYKPCHVIPHISCGRLVIPFSLFYTWGMWGLTEVKCLAQSCFSDKWQNLNSNSHLVDSQAGGLRALHHMASFHVCISCCLNILLYLSSSWFYSLPQGVSYYGEWETLRTVAQNNIINSKGWTKFTCSSEWITNKLVFLILISTMKLQRDEKC